MTWPSVEASRMCRRRLKMHAQAACVVEQAWFPHKRCSIGEDKPRLSPTKPQSQDEKYIWGLIPLKASRERAKITTLRDKKCRTVTVIAVGDDSSGRRASVVKNLKISRKACV